MQVMEQSQPLEVEVELLGGTCFIPRGHVTLILNGAIIFEDGRFGPVRVFQCRRRPCCGD